MKIMIDTTVFLAECLLPEQKYPKVFRKIVANDRLVFPQAQLDEIMAIMGKFFPNECDTVELFLEKFSFELAGSDERSEGYPFLGEAKSSGVEQIITLDPDMEGTEIDGIRFVSVDSYLSE